MQCNGRSSTWIFFSWTVKGKAHLPGMGHNAEKAPLSQRRIDILPKFLLVVIVPNFPAVTVSKKKKRVDRHSVEMARIGDGPDFLTLFNLMVNVPIKKASQKEGLKGRNRLKAVEKAWVTNLALLFLSQICNPSLLTQPSVCFYLLSLPFHCLTFQH